MGRLQVTCLEEKTPHPYTTTGHQHHGEGSRRYWQKDKHWLWKNKKELGEGSQLITKGEEKVFMSVNHTFSQMSSH